MNTDLILINGDIVVKKGLLNTATAGISLATVFLKLCRFITARFLA